MLTPTSSHNDDSSVTDSLSSVTDSAWDVIEEASAASDDDGSNAPRHHTPLSDQPEHIHPDEGSLASNDGSSEAHGLGPSRHIFELGVSRKNSMSDPPDTAKRIEPGHGGFSPFAKSFGGKRSENPPYIKFEEPPSSVLDGGVEHEVSFPLTVFEGQKHARLCKQYRLPPATELHGMVCQSLRSASLKLEGPFKVLFTGSTQMKAPILEKIGAALAADLAASTKESIDSSRVTIVPISAFAENTSPDVVLIDSMGLDMAIEECTSASMISKDGRAAIRLQLNNQTVVRSSWDNAKAAYVLDRDYRPPDLAVIYLAEDESTVLMQQRDTVCAFLTRHGVPLIFVSFDTEWEKDISFVPIDPRSPHLCIRAFGSNPQVPEVLGRLPIDLNTFLSLDAGQMNRNLASLTQADRTQSKDLESGLERSKSRSYQSYEVRAKNSFGIPFPTTAADRKRLSKLALLLLLPMIWSMLFAILKNCEMSGSFPFIQPKVARIDSPPKLCPTGNPESTLIVPSVVPSDISSNSPKTVALGQRPTTDLASLLLETKPMPNRSEKFQVQVIGDHHIVLRPPKWFTSLRKKPTLLFDVQREGTPLDFEFLTMFDGIFALKVDVQSAHGLVDIRIWTAKKPQINETFQVDLGTPWLKVRSWQQAAQAMAQQVRGELQNAQTGLSRAYGSTNERLQFLLKDMYGMADGIFGEFERAYLDSFQHTARTTDFLLKSSKRVSQALTEQFLQKGERNSRKLKKQSRKMQKDLRDYSQKASKLLSQQAQSLAEAASSIKLLALRQGIQEYRETHFREAQKKMLQAWWKMRGQPALKAKSKRKGKLFEKGKSRGARKRTDKYH